jgi:lysophospholipase L1-like esterase
MNRTRWFDLGAITLAIAVSVGVVGVSWSSPAKPTAVSSKVADQRGAGETRPLVLFIGDSYTEGKSTREMSYGCRAAVQLNLLCAVSAMGGTGYISGGVANRWVDPYGRKSFSFRERISHLAVEYDPAIVVLDGGRNDEFPPREDVYEAMLSTISETRRTWPKAQIIFVRPRFLANPRGDLGFDDGFMAQLESAPTSRGVIFIDPMSALFDTDTSGMLAADGIHPNSEGEDLMTTALRDSLVLGIMGVGSSS